MRIHVSWKTVKNILEEGMERNRKAPSRSANEMYRIHIKTEVLIIFNGCLSVSKTKYEGARDMKEMIFLGLTCRDVLVISQYVSKRKTS